MPRRTVAHYLSGCACKGMSRDGQIKDFWGKRRRWGQLEGLGAIRPRSSLDPFQCPSFLYFLSTMMGVLLFLHKLLRPWCSVRLYEAKLTRTESSKTMSCRTLSSFQWLGVCHFVATTGKAMNTDVRTSSLLSSKNPCHLNFIKP